MWRIKTTATIALYMHSDTQVCLLGKSIPADANVFFYFESTTQQSDNFSVTINECARKILAMKNGDKIIEKIERKVKDGNLSLKSRAEKYQEQCPHAHNMYMCVASEFEEDTERRFRGSYQQSRENTSKAKTRP